MARQEQDHGAESRCGRILVAEDDRFYRQILARRLQACGHDVMLTADGQEAWEVLQRDPPELLLSDWMMPRLDGYELCRMVKDDQRLRSIYCIVLTAKDRVEDKVSALDVGADDYLLKPCDDGELLARVRTGLRVHRLHARLEEVSITDSLTGLKNRRYFDQRLAEEVARSRRYHLPLSLLCVDLDRFKAINDQYGHPVGDQALVAVAEAIRDRVRAGEVVARLGGDEFAVILPNTSIEGARVVCAAIEEIVAGIQIPAHPLLKMGGSAGATEFDPESGTEAFVEAADAALYARKLERRAAAAPIPR